MKMLSWVKEKVKQLSEWHGRKKYGDIPRFNQVAPNCPPPSKEKRKFTRRYAKMMRFYSMQIRGCPVLTGERLRKTLACCDPANLIVKPSYRAEISLAAKAGTP